MTPNPGQYMKALGNANDTRITRARVKRELFAKEITFQEAMEHWSTATMLIGDLLMSQRRWGQGRVDKILQRVPVSDNRPINKMTNRQKKRLLELLKPKR